MFEAFNKLPEMYQGIIALVVGTLLLLHALGFVVMGIKFIIIIFGAYLLAVGCLKSGLYKKVTNAINHMQKK